MSSNPSLLAKVPAVKWGLEKESDVREALKIYIKKRTNFEMSKCGLLIDREMSLLGATPDGIVKCSCGTSVLEIKCPYKYKDCTPLAVKALQDKN